MNNRNTKLLFISLTLILFIFVSLFIYSEIKLTGMVIENVQEGLNGSYYNNADFTDLKKSKLDLKINFDWGIINPIFGIAPDTFSVRWEGYTRPDFSDFNNSLASPIATTSFLA